MPVDSRGSIVHVVASNRAGFRSDAIVDGLLLATTIAKTINIVDSNGVIAVASRVTITNHSGQTAALIFWVSGEGMETKTVLNADNIGTVPKKFPIITDISKNALHILDGETIEVYERVYKIVETNIGGATQTGIGVRYNVTLEPRHRG